MICLECKTEEARVKFCSDRCANLWHSNKYNRANKYLVRQKARDYKYRISRSAGMPTLIDKQLKTIALCMYDDDDINLA